MKNLNGILGASLSIFILLSGCGNPKPTADYSGWRTYAGSKDGIRYSSNDQVDTSNVGQLQVAWSYSSGDKDTANRSQNQCNPIVVDGILYGTSPRMKLLALDAGSGEVKWIFDPASVDESSRNDPNAFIKIGRGVVYWQDADGSDKRILYNVGAKMYAVNVADGSHIKNFGVNGFIDMADGLDRDKATFDNYLATTTPGVIYRNLYIVGMRVSESADAAPGHIRAYDVRTGKLVWIFHTIPHPGEKGYETWPDKDAWKKLGGANSWAGMTLDEKTGIVYVPTGTVSGDFYGGFRKGQNLFGNSLLALEAATGKYIWHYQVIHHDLWDRDLPTNPNLVTVNHDGKKIDAIAQITKHGFVFLFDRASGQPIFPIEEKSFPTTPGLPGEELWPSQPVPTLPEPFARQHFNREDVSDLTAETHEELLKRFDSVKYNGAFLPPSKNGSWIFPGYDGGGEWGGAAVDPESAILYVNSSEMPWALVMIDVPADDNDGSLRGIGKSVYSKNCVTCHGPELKGNGSSFPSLVGLQKKRKKEEVLDILENGKNMMPAFKRLKDYEKEGLLTFLLNLPEKEGPSAKRIVREKKKSILDEVPYTMTGYNRFLDKNGYPGIKPPWGTLNAVDLNTGKLLWKVPHGEYDELTRRGIPPTGTENYGGPLVTKGGVIFIAGTKDEKIRAYSKANGKVLWEAKLPAAGFATPATYTVNGKQYVVIACGGGKIGNKSGDAYVAFALK